jgi:hypothetical protein
MRLDNETGIRRRRLSLGAQQFWLITVSLVLLFIAVPASWAIVPSQEKDGDLHQLVFSSPNLHPTTELQEINAAQANLQAGVSSAWSEIVSGRSLPGVWNAQVDRRSGLVEISEGEGVPWVPGYGNRLELADAASFLSGRGQVDIETLESIARSFLHKVGPLLGSEAYALRLNLQASGRLSDYLWFVEFDVYAGDLRIEGARVFFRVNNGNLVQFGAEKVPAPGTPVPVPLLSRDDALAELESYAGLVPGQDWLIDKGSLVLLPVAAGDPKSGYTFGSGYDLLPIWELSFRRGDEHPTWRVRVNAVTGEILEFIDTNRYSQVTGGYWPVSWRVNGVEQGQVVTGWPFTTINPLGTTSNTSGLYSWDGNPQTAYHTGPYVNINDNCSGAPGTASSDGAGNIAFGEITVPDAPGDCQIQLGINDNTPSARQQFWHLNKIKEKGRSYLPSNTWLQAQLTANVNIDNNCNAFWNGATVNFYTSGGGCGNTGEDAGISMHEWAHGLDSNDGNGSSLENGTGETYGDFTAALQTFDSCIGQGFLGGNCGGYGNPCSSCDGVRDIDWGQHSSNAPMTVASFTQPLCPSDSGGNYNGPCGNGAPQPDDREGHCESYVSSGALWDLAAADLQSGCTNRNALFPDYNCPGAGGPYNQAGAFQVVDRLWYLSRPTADQAFTCYRTNPTWTSDGCNAGSNWKTFRAIDDDDGNLANGTPHACQIAAAFNRHGIGNTAGSPCASDNITCYRACPQPAAPTLNPVTAGNNQITLNWTPEPSPDVIDVFRNEIGCGSGFARIANDVSGIFFVDNEVANGTTYYYQIVRHPVGNEACASPPSNCVSGTPVAGPSAKYVPESATLVSVPTDNDGDGFVDNCETGRIQVTIVNDGNSALTNVRFTVTSPDTEVTIASAMPVNVGSLALSSQTTGTFDFDLDGAVCAQYLDFDISVTADEMAGPNIDSFSYGPVEQDLILTPSRTDDFETGSDGWTFVQGYTRESGPADSGSWSVHSSSGLDDQNDVALSPVFQKGAGATSVVIAERHDIEAPYWDRANVHAIRLSDGSHTLLTPTGRTYTAGGPWNPVGHVGTEPGWAGTDLSWGDATFDLSGLSPGESYQLEINYNTDALFSETGHWFDNVRWNNVSFQVCDAQSDLCTPCTPPDAPTGLTASATAANQITLDWNAVSPAPSQYRIYRATISGGPYSQVGSVGGGTLSFNDTGLLPGVTYYYVVRAVETCESADSNEASDTAFGDCTTAPIFGGLTSVIQIAAGGSCGLRLEWAAGSNNCNSGPVVYNVYRSTTSGFTPAAGNLLQSCVTNTFYDDTLVSGGTTYYYVVRAEDATIGNGGACQDGNTDGNTTEVSGAPPSGSPVLLYDQTANQAPGYTSQSFSDFPSYSNERAADFVVGGGGWTVDRVVVSGSYNNPLAGLNPTVDVRFYADDGGGVPLSLPQDPAVCTNTGLVSGVDFVDTAGSFDITLPTPCLLPAGRYWVSVVANRPYFPGGVQWFWNSVTVIGGSEHAWRNPGDGFGTGCTSWSNGATSCSQTNPDVAFQIWGPGSGCTAAPNSVPFLTATASDGQNEIEWLNPAAGGYGSTMVRWSTSGYPADPTDGTLLVDQNDGLGGRGSATHGSLTNGTTYHYSVFVDNGSGEYSARKTVSARPFDTSGNVAWAYSTGASALAPPGIGSVYGVANDRVLHSMNTVGTGTWPAGWSPLAMNGPAQNRPPIVPVSVGGATKVAFLGSHDRRVYAVNADTGQQIWSSPDLGAMVQAAPAGMFTAFGGSVDLLIVGTRTGSSGNSLHGLNLANGTIAWTFSNTVAQGGDDLGIGIISGTASIDYANSRAYFTSRRRSGGSANTVWCVSFNGSSVSLVWARSLADIDASPILHGGRLYVGTNSGEVHALDPANGADLWASPFDTSNGPVKGYVWPRVGTNEILFSTTDTLWSVTDNGADAALDWSLSSIANPSVPMASIVGGSPYAWVGSSDGRLYQLEISGAPVITSVVLGDGTASVGSPAMDAAAEIAYSGTENGRLYSVSLPLP